MYSTIPIRPEVVRDNWVAYSAWVNTLQPEARALWEEYGNDDDGPGTQLIPGTMTIGDRQVGADVWAVLNDGAKQDLFEWWYQRNPQHNLDFFTRFAPHPVDNRHLMNRWFAYTAKPYFMKIGPWKYGSMPHKPWWPPPPHWIKRPPYGGAFDYGFDF